MSPRGIDPLPEPGDSPRVVRLLTWGLAGTGVLIVVAAFALSHWLAAG